MRRHLQPPLLRPPLLLPRLGSTPLCSARVGSLSFFIRIGWRFRLFHSLPRLLSSNCSALKSKALPTVLDTYTSVLVEEDVLPQMR
ncbi:unnamed protein product [Hydatigera taeniaeformis]|uniref:Secreted protein n=1 Tax=Hydatigena taeniaeformis TaxID=6205 RepID=A0A0R3WY28_HYDTA|nr:unnamed protein product [Hydatigera taeniaeformis]